MIKKFFHDGFELAFYDKGEGEPILLIHGFASSARINWIVTGWVKILLLAGYRVLAIDNRGHGNSDKSYNTHVYAPEKMADDAIALLDFLSIKKAHIMGYSMGAKIAAFVNLRAPNRVHTAVFGGLAENMITGVGNWQVVFEALLVEDYEKIRDPRGLMFRKFSEKTKSDRKALAACVMTFKKELTKDQIRMITAPVFVVAGTKDEIAGAVAPLASLLPRGEALEIPNRDHMLTVGDKLYKKSVLDFLARHPIHM